MSLCGSAFTDFLDFIRARFRCIVYPFKQKMTIATSKLIIIIIWVLAVSIMCPSGVMLQVTKEQRVRIVLGSFNDTRPFYWCRENWPTQEMRKVYTTVLFANIYLAPLSLIVIMYARIGFTLSKPTPPVMRGSRTASEEGTPNNKSSMEGRHTISRKKTRVIMMLLVVALLFILSWLPLWTLMMLSDYASLTEHQHRVINIYVYPLAHWLAFFNSSINPIIYGFFNENFRRGFQAAFKFQLCTGDSEGRKSHTHRIRGDVVLPVQLAALHKSGSGGRSGSAGNGMRSCQEEGCLDIEHTEEGVVMEELKKMSQI